MKKLWTCESIEVLHTLFWVTLLVTSSYDVVPKQNLVHGTRLKNPLTPSWRRKRQTKWIYHMCTHTYIYIYVYAYIYVYMYIFILFVYIYIYILPILTHFIRSNRPTLQTLHVSCAVPTNTLLMPRHLLLSRFWWQCWTNESANDLHWTKRLKRMGHMSTTSYLHCADLLTHKHPFLI